MSGAAPLGASDEERFIEKFGDHLRIFQGIINYPTYSQSQISPVINYKQLTISL